MKNKKDIKIGDLISYLFSSSDLTIPEEFIFQEKNVKKYVIYLLEYIWHFPKIIEYFQKYNHLYNKEIIDNPFEFLKFLKNILKDNNISSYQFKSEFFNFYQEVQKIKKLENEAFKQKRQFVDLFTELKIAKIKNKTVKLSDLKDSSKKNSGIDMKNIKDKIKKVQEYQISEIKKKSNAKKNFLKEINEEIIENLQLTIIDIFIDEKHNQLVYIFLDKNFKKCYYVTSFKFDFFISKKFGIIRNDYLELYNPGDYIKYTVYNFWDYNNLRRSVNLNYKKFMSQ